MLVRWFWPASHASEDKAHAFWVEATQAEAEAAIFPHLSADVIAESRRLAKECAGIAKHLGDPPRPFCFLVARDLGHINPYVVHYPFHQLWNAYSPFREMPEQHIAGLEELRELECPFVD